MHCTEFCIVFEPVPVSKRTGVLKRTWITMEFGMVKWVTRDFFPKETYAKANICKTNVLTYRPFNIHLCETWVTIVGFGLGFACLLLRLLLIDSIVGYPTSLRLDMYFYSAMMLYLHWQSFLIVIQGYSVINSDSRTNCILPPCTENSTKVLLKVSNLFSSLSSLTLRSSRIGHLVGSSCFDLRSLCSL